MLVMILDLIFTIAGQPSYYWNVDFSFLNEGSPLGVFLLSRNPVFFIIFFFFYLLFVLFLITNLRRPFNIMAGIGFFLGHAWGSSTWVPLLFSRYFYGDFADWYLTIGYFIILAIIFGICINAWLNTWLKHDVIAEK